MTDIARQIATLHAQRIEAARTARSAGQLVVGYVGLDVPEELILAAGMIPLRLEADMRAPAAAAARFGTGGHPVLRSLVARLLGGPYEFIDHLIVGCLPRYQAALSVLINELQATDPEFKRFQVHQLDLLHSDSASARQYTQQSIDALAACLATWSRKTLDTDALRAAIALCNETRRLLAAYQQLRTDGAHLDGVSALRLYGCATGAGRAEFNARLREWLHLGALGDLPDQRPPPRILYSGSATDSTDFYAAIEAAGMRIIDDDQDFGARALGPLVDEQTEPLPAIAAAYAGRAPSPAGWHHEARSAWLRRRLTDDQADGVLFYSAAYDHPPAWEYPAQRALAESMGCSCTLLEPQSYTQFAGITPAAREFAVELMGRRQGTAA